MTRIAGDRGSGVSRSDGMTSPGTGFDKSEGIRGKGDGMPPTATLNAAGSLDDGPIAGAMSLPLPPVRTGILARKAGRAILPPGTDIGSSAAAARAVGARPAPVLSPRLRAGLLRAGGVASLQRRGANDVDESEGVLLTAQRDQKSRLSGGRGSDERSDVEQ